MKRWMTLVTIVAFALAAPVALADESKKEEKASEKRAKIDARAAETLEELFAENAKANTLYEQAAGYAVFGNWKFALGISGGGGTGVAVDKASGSRTYMKMGTAGVGFGLGGKKYQVVFFFEKPEQLRNFVDKGWQADASATAAAGTAAADASTGFIEGIAIYQITESGLMARADIAGTKYWKDKKLNE